MDEVKCTSKENTLLECQYVSIDTKKCDEDSFVAVECSGTVTLSLNLNGRRGTCAGLVEFSTPDGIFGVCNYEWDKIKAKKICQELGCGDPYNIPKPGVFVIQQSKQSVSLNCLGNEQYSWQCIERSDCKEGVGVICSNHAFFRLRDGSNACSGLVEKYTVEEKSWKPLQQKNEKPEVICTQMNCGSAGNFTNANGTSTLTCSDTVKLNNFTAQCFGDVSFSVNGVNYEVCYSDSIQSQKKLGTVVCRELGCGDMVRVQKGAGTTGFLSDVECQGDEPSLWHCLAIRSKITCSKTKVICSDSLDVRLSDGLGRCSGRVEVKWEGSWRPIGSDKDTVNLDMVCGHFNCGTHIQVYRELFFKGEQQSKEWLWSVRCKSSSGKVNECFESAVLMPPRDKNQKNMEIICQKEELKFFEGNSPCKGKVYIEQFNGETQWLPANPLEKKTASDLCIAMECGSLVSFEKEQSTAHANVTCSGSKTVALQNQLEQKCWGTVKVCSDNKCGGVCSNTWRRDEDSKMICGNLGCGEPIQASLPFTKIDLLVTYHSMYCSEKVQNMNMCNFIPDKNSACSSPANVICAESIKPKLEDPRDKCAGKVSLFYAGEWTPVCTDSLGENLKNTICKELLCGKSINDQNDMTMHEESKSTGLSTITCRDSDNSVSKCDFSKVYKKACLAGYLKCTDWERLLLYEKEGECSGPVYCLQGGKTQQVSGTGWSQEEGQKLCEYLQCGNYISHSPILNNKTEWQIKPYNFSGNNKIWQCKSHDQSIEKQLQLNIKCDRKPTNISLSDNCKGNLLIDNKHVCAYQWNGEMSHKLCERLNCGKALHSWLTDSATKNCLHFSCTGKETLVGQCGFKNGDCRNTLSVACTDGIEFSTTEKCGGKLGIRYNDQWQYVCGKLTENDIRTICDILKCKDSQELLDEQKIVKAVNVKINCPSKHYKISQCMHLKYEKCSHTPTEIQCEGYTPRGNSSVGLIMGLLGGMLGLLILFLIWTNRKHLLLALRHFRNMNRKEVNPNVNEMSKMDTEDKDSSEGKASFLDKDDYEDVDSLVDESGEEEDEDDRKRGSSGTEYDDIEGQANEIFPSQTHREHDLNLPLLPRRPENMLDQDTYEVEIEEQEDYDDVIPVEVAANENAGTAGAQAHEGADSDLDAALDENADAVLVSTEVEVHTQPE
ncbi:scavenger receptor cysteine-rich type 1 protein M160 isoform X1 [Puntigrus tetrazona]|uniref:scavenger receptor cysteine-rich type 1 protein M160 isoform X1 n=1 Tax=Puntigrus tetrazona TaxID=1606681 RepID=UPI001C8A1077|nr:scavenger receptor cysteine-rich type 1 protein M160 isoform X1 [Puntigrus tetrazona]